MVFSNGWCQVVLVVMWCSVPCGPRCHMVLGAVLSVECYTSALSAVKSQLSHVLICKFLNFSVTSVFLSV